MVEENLMPSFDDFELNDSDLNSLGDIIGSDEVTDETPQETTETQKTTETENPSEDPEIVDPESVAAEESSTEGDDGKSSPNLFSSTAKVLHEQGLLPSYDDSDIESADDFAKLFANEVDNQFKAKLVETLGEDGAKFVLDGVPLNAVKEHTDSMTALDTITDEQLSDDIELSKKVILQDAVNQGMSEARATKYLSRLTDLGEEAILAEAKESLEGVKSFAKEQIAKQAEQIKQNNLAEQKRIEAEQKKFEKSIYDTKSLGDNISFDKGFQDKVVKSITTIVGEDSNGNPENQLMKDRRSNPIEFDTKLYYVYELTKGFTDWSAFTSSGKTSAVKELERAMRSSQHTNVGSGSYSQADPNSYDNNLGDEINL